jgi:hypothetical protein
MVRKGSDSFVEPRYRYGAVETALAKVFGADAKAQAGVLRGRIKHFQKLGLPGLEVGKGARVLYSYEQAAQWLIGLFLNDIGIEPRTIVELFNEYWAERLVIGVKWATDTTAKAGNPALLTVRPQQMLARFGKRKVEFFGLLRRFTPRSKEPETIGMFLDHPEDGAITVFNLTHAFTQLEAAGIRWREDGRP